MVVGALWTDYKDDGNLKGMDSLWIFGSTFSSRMEFLFFFLLVKISFSRYNFFCCKQDKIWYKIQLGKLLGKPFFFLLYIKFKRNKKIFMKLFYLFLYIQKKEFIFGLQSQILFFSTKKMLDRKNKKKIELYIFPWIFPSTMYE